MENNILETLHMWDRVEKKPGLKVKVELFDAPNRQWLLCTYVNGSEETRLYTSKIRFLLAKFRFRLTENHIPNE